MQKHSKNGWKNQEKEGIKENRQENDIDQMKSHEARHRSQTHVNSWKPKINRWKIISGILFVLLMISFFYTGGAANSISKEEASVKAISYINNNLLEAGTRATVKNVEQTNNLYNIKMDIDGKEFDSYISMDGKLLFPSAVNLDVQNEPAQSTPTEPGGTDTVDMVSLMDDDAIEGDPDAPVTIIEWSDYECPYCGRFYSQTYGQILKNYIETGKVKFVYRDFPLSFHAQAQKAAEAAECAGEQGKYYDMYNLLFAKGVAGGVSSFKQYAVDLGLNTEEFNKCLDAGAMADEIAKDFQDGQSVGITGTPGFLINGQLVVGAQPYSVFEKIIEEALIN